MKSRLAVMAVTLAAFVWLGCTVPSGQTPGTTEPETTSIDGRAVEGNTRFGLQLFMKLMDMAPGENVLISPASISLALAMTYNGAEGHTKEAMASTLGIAGLELEEANDAYARLENLLEKAAPGIELTMANSLWGRKGVAFKKEFIERIRGSFKATAVELDFEDPDAPTRINDWVTRETGGLIDSVVERIEPDTILYLINAIHFHGEWAVRFPGENTHEAPFTLWDGTQRLHPMMSQTGEYLYQEHDGFQAARLPYGDGRFAMYVFLPEPDYCVVAFSEALAENWSHWMSGFEATQIDLVFPRFAVEYDSDLSNPLKALGMDVAFDHERAEFGGMCPIPPKVFIGSVMHKTTLNCDEKGTKAAAATAVEMKIEAALETPSMVVNRPFILAIQDDEAGVLLFLGCVADPKEIS